jgi:hypothetical protein
MQGASGHVLGYCAGWRVKLDLKVGMAEEGGVFVHEARGGPALNSEAAKPRRKRVITLTGREGRARSEG